MAGGLVSGCQFLFLFFFFGCFASTLRAAYLPLSCPSPSSSSTSPFCSPSSQFSLIVSLLYLLGPFFSLRSDCPSTSIFLDILLHFSINFYRSLRIPASLLLHLRRTQQQRHPTLRQERVNFLYTISISLRLG